MEFDLSKFNQDSWLRCVEMQKATKSDTALALINDKYPRGFKVITGGSLTVWTRDGQTKNVKKFDIGTVASDFTWTYGGIFGIAETTSLGEETTADNIIWIP